MSDLASIEAMWAAFEAAHPELAEGAEYSAWHFCDNKSDADELAELVVAGVKRATAGALWSYEDEDEALPQVGDCSVITDWDGNARCIIRTTAVEIVPFEAVSEEFAAIEGEGDGSLEYWRRAHWAAFTREFAGTDHAVSSSMPVVCEWFDLVFAPEECA